MENTERLGETVRDLVESGRRERLAQVLAEAHAADIAAALRDLPVAEQVTVFRLLTRDQAGSVLGELNEPTLSELAAALDPAELSGLLDRLPPEDAAQVLEELPAEQSEQVLDLCRRHPLYLWPRVVLILLLALVPPAVIAFAMSKADAYEGTAAKVFWVAAGVYLVYWAFRLFLTWYRYDNDIWVVTNQRIIDSVKNHPFHLRLSTADLVNIQDMTVERSGVVRTLFDFGDILCQTAAELQEFRLAGIPHPREVQALVDRERDRERARPV